MTLIRNNNVFFSTCHHTRNKNVIIEKHSEKKKNYYNTLAHISQFCIVNIFYLEKNHALQGCCCCTQNDLIFLNYFHV